MWTDLPQGTPESEAAYYDNYNGGYDQYSRAVSNPAAVDQSIDVAAANGLDYLENTWMTVTYNWETGDGGALPVDSDGDGWSATGGDCNDGNGGVFPGAAEVADGVDQDCDGAIDEGTSASDDDGDGVSEDGGDCNDGDPGVHPGLADPADGIDNDCDGSTDEDEPPTDDDVTSDDDSAPIHGTSSADDDGDGYCETSPCDGGLPDGDCNDGSATIHPGAEDVPDGQDNDCNGVFDDLVSIGRASLLPGGEGCGGGCSSGDAEATVRGWMVILALAGLLRRNNKST